MYPEWNSIPRKILHLLIVWWLNAPGYRLHCIPRYIYIYNDLIHICTHALTQHFQSWKPYTFSDPCPKDFTYVPNGYRCHYYDYRHQLSWFQAAEFCESRGGGLLALQTKYKFEMFMEWYKTSEFSCLFWLFPADLNNKGRVWALSERCWFEGACYPENIMYTTRFSIVSLLCYYEQILWITKA